MQVRVGSLIVLLLLIFLGKIVFETGTELNRIPASQQTTIEP